MYFQTLEQAEKVAHMSYGKVMFSRKQKLYHIEGDKAAIRLAANLLNIEIIKVAKKEKSFFAENKWYSLFMIVGIAFAAIPLGMTAYVIYEVEKSSTDYIECKTLTDFLQDTCE